MPRTQKQLEILLTKKAIEKVQTRMLKTPDISSNLACSFCIEFRL